MIICRKGARFIPNAADHRYRSLCRFWSQQESEIFHQLFQSTSCPAPVLRLCAPQILRTFPVSKQTESKELQIKTSPVNPAALRKLALQILGLATKDGKYKLCTYPMNTCPKRRFTDGNHVLTPPPPSLTNPVFQAIDEALTQARTGNAPSLDIDCCLLYTNPITFLTTFWTVVSNAVTGPAELEACRRLATYVLSTPRSPHSPPLLPIFLHVVLPSLITLADHLTPTAHSVQVELIVGVISSALTAALFIEWALLSVCKEQRLVLGQPALSMARRLGGDLRRRADSRTSGMIVQRLSTSQAFTTNFPTFMTDV